jgi:hypothetical protein
VGKYDAMTPCQLLGFDEIVGSCGARAAISCIQDLVVGWRTSIQMTLEEAMAVSMQCDGSSALHGSHPNTNKIRQHCTVPNCEHTEWCYPGMGCFEDAAVDSPEIVREWTTAVHNFAQMFEFGTSSSLHTD